MVPREPDRSGRGCAATKAADTARERTAQYFKIIEKSKDEVSVYILARVTMKAGAIEKAHSSYTRTLMAAEWEGDDWKMSSTATLRAAQQVEGKPRPAIAAPGDKWFNRAGWTTIRRTS